MSLRTLAVVCALFGLRTLAMAAGQQTGDAARTKGPFTRPGAHTMLYSTASGDRFQLRLRSFPSPGSEKVLWESPAEEDPYHLLYYSPSPSFTHVAICWVDMLASGGKLSILDVNTGRTESLTEGPDVRFMLWENDNVLSWLSATWQSTYDLATGEVRSAKMLIDPAYEGLGENTAAALSYLEPPFAQETALVVQLLRSGNLPGQMKGKYASLAIARCVGVPRLVPLWRFGVWWLAAVSPDRQWAAVTTGRDVIFVMDLDTRMIGRIIPLTRLLEWETVSARDLRWSSDSTCLTFTEAHYHAAKYRPLDLGGPPGYLDTTSLIRLYHVPTDEVYTVAVGSNAFLMPPSATPWKEKDREGPCE